MPPPSWIWCNIRLFDWRHSLSVNQRLVEDRFLPAEDFFLLVDVMWLLWIFPASCSWKEYLFFPRVGCVLMAGAAAAAAQLRKEREKAKQSQNSQSQPQPNPPDFYTPARLPELKTEEGYSADIVRTLCRHCADIVPKLCGHISPGIYVRTMSALYPSARFSALEKNGHPGNWLPSAKNNAV